MEANCSKLTEKILQLTLEIIYLLTGEDNIVAKKTSGDGHNSILVPLQSLLIPQRNNEQQAHTSTDGSSNENPPERCPRLLYSRDSTHEDLTIPHRHQVDLTIPHSHQVDLTIPHRHPAGVTIPHHLQVTPMVDVKIEIKEEEEMYVNGIHQSMKESEIRVTNPKEESSLDVSTDGSCNGNPLERCPYPLYSQDCTQEELAILHHHQGEEVFEMNTGIRKVIEEIYVGETNLSVMEAEMMVTVTKEESTLDDSTEGHNIQNTSEGSLILLSDYANEDLVIAQSCPVVSSFSQGEHSDLNDMERSTDGFNSKVLNDKTYTVISNVQPSFQCADRQMNLCNTEESSSSSHLVVPKTIHTKEKLFSYYQCEKTFVKKSLLLKQKRVHTDEKPFSCSECGKCFSRKEHRNAHMKIHTREKAFSCSDCGLGFSNKVNRDNHMRFHTSEKPYTCSECGKGFFRKEYRDNHMRTHTGEKPFSCAECGKSFSSKEGRYNHMRVHAGVKPFSCSECGKGYSSKLNLEKHMKVHTGEKPFSCSECGKGFFRKEYRDNHVRTHTGEKPFSCAECGKSFSSKEGRYNHMRVHAGVKPFSCSVCGKGFSSKLNLEKHMKFHTGMNPFSCP